MVSVRPPFPRPATAPLVRFERFNVEGNSEDAAVYSEETGLIVYKNKHYMTNTVIKDSYVIDESFLMEDYRAEEHILVRFRYRPGDYVLQASFRFTVLPTLKEEDKTKLTSMLHTFTGDMTKEVQHMKESIERLKGIIKVFNENVKSEYPGFKFEEDLDISIPTTKELDEEYGIEAGVESLLETMDKISASQPFSKKRKASD
jgi:hypothetical protein